MLAAEALGYQSVWIAEHHSMRLFAEQVAPALTAPVAQARLA